MPLVGFIGPAYELGSKNVDAQQCINWFPQINELGTGKNQEVAALVQRPGLTLRGTAGTGPCRGTWERTSGGATHGVSGNKLYDITNPASPVERGTLQTAVGPVGMADNGLQLLIVDGEKGYVLTYADNSFLTITDPDFPRATHCAFQDQYLIVNEVGTRRFQVSALAGATDWDALDFASKEGLPDNLLALVVDHRELILAGLKSTETWVNTGDQDFPFERIDGAFLEFGLSAAHTLLKFDNTVYGVARSQQGMGIVGRMAGRDTQRISTIPIERTLSSYGDISGGTAWGYELNRHAFYNLNFPGVPTTWTVDAQTGHWHERRSTDANGVMSRWRAQYHAICGTEHIVGDYENGNLYALDEDNSTDNGNPIFRRRRSPHASAEGKRLFCRSFELQMESGAGPMPHLTDANGAPRDPMVMFRASKDGGHTWGQERMKSAGRAGEFTKRVLWNRLGEARDWVFEVTISDAFRATLISGLPDFRLGR